MTIVPRTGPFSASCALARTSWYQRGKSSACAVSTFAIGLGWYRPAPATFAVRPALGTFGAGPLSLQIDTFRGRENSNGCRSVGIGPRLRHTAQPQAP